MTASSSRPQATTRARAMLAEMRTMLAAIRSSELPAGPAYRHRVEGGITVLEALLGEPPSLGRKDH